MHRRQTAHWRGRALSAILFDLDGTLLDTVGDIALALNRTLHEYGMRSIAEGDVRHMIGRGAPVLVERATAAQDRVVDPTTQTAIVERFFHHYGELEESNDDTAQPFAGAVEALRRVHTAGLRTAVVTNKQHRFADSLLKRRGLSHWIDTVVGGDTCVRRKPDPQPLIYACDALGVPPSQALMIGDSINDVQAARGAAMPIICVSYGYNEGRDPHTLDCDALLDTLAELPGLLEVP